MLHNVTDLRGERVLATDGEVGKVEQVYFDDRQWRARWLVVDTGGWLAGRKVLIPPASIDRARSSERAIAVILARNQVKDSPGVDAARPVSRRYEEAYARYYGVPLYWVPAEAAGLSTTERAERSARKLGEAEREAAESHLRSSEQVIGYSIRAADGLIGHVEDLRAGKRVLVPPAAVEDIDWESKEVRLRMSREEVKRACPAI